jgi:hypothetical protein
LNDKQISSLQDEWQYDQMRGGRGRPSPVEAGLVARTIPAPAPSQRPPTAPAGPLVLERYRLRRRLGSGAFGTVWLAHDERLAREVAIKEIPVHSDRPGEEERGRREALAAARLAHPGIVMLYEAGAEEGRLWLASELVRGETLQRLLAEGALSDRDVLRIGVVLCDALAHAHAQGVIHRDVKPSNVMIPDEPELGAGVAKLTDFGVAHVAGDEALTHTGDVVGTLAYMAPEQADGQRVTGAADLYALALVLYEGLTGSNPVRAPGAAATARRVGMTLPPVCRRRRDLPAELGAGLDRALLPLPAERGELVDLREALAGSLPEVSDEGGTIAPSAFERARDRRRPGALGARAGAGAAAALAAGVALSYGGSHVPSHLALATIAGVIVAILPRVGWLAAGAGAVTMLATGGRPGAALLGLLALLGCPVLMRRRGLVWTIPALAPLLALAPLAPAYVALAGLHRRWFTRAALGALGAWWLELLELDTGRVALFGRPGHLAPPAHLASSIDAAWHGVVQLVLAGTPLACLVWALFAVVLPFAARGRSLFFDVPLLTAWAAGLAAATQAIAVRAGAPARGALAGAILAALFTLLAVRFGDPPGSRSMAEGSGSPP